MSEDATNKELEEIGIRISELYPKKQKLESSLKYLGKILFEYKTGLRFEWDGDTLKKTTDEEYAKVRNIWEETNKELNIFYDKRHKIIMKNRDAK